MSDNIVLVGDCVEVMASMGANDFDAIVTDPPYELGFMGKGWDSAGVSFKQQTWAAALRVAKPGAHLVAFGGTRTYHRIACAIEDAGWEIRDCLSWLYGSGFPKSLDVSKAIDRAAGATRAIVGPSRRHAGQSYQWAGAVRHPTHSEDKAAETAPATDAARQWQGWGTALKPAWEPIILARKPLIGTVVANVQKHGTGAINVDGCRLDTAGRWPANVALDEEAAAALDEMSSASRFFYVAKASRGEREAGLEGMPKSHPIGGADKWTEVERRKGEGVTRRPATNVHPTVKPISLMRWLVRLVTPPGGTVLDPFSGSGTTGCAASLEGFDFVGIEQSEEYAKIARARIAHWSPQQATLL